MTRSFLDRSATFGDLATRYGVLGGPVSYLANAGLNDDLYSRVYVFNFEASVQDGALAVVLFCAIENHQGPFPAPPAGYTIRTSICYLKDPLGATAEAELVFTWVRWKQFFVPPHWLQLGVERCIAMHRIFGSDETTWPALESAL